MPGAGAEPPDTAADRDGDPPPLGPLPPVGDGDDPLYFRHADIDGSPTRPIRRMELPELVVARDSLDSIPPGGAPEPERGPDERTSPHAVADEQESFSWSEAPELPEPPVQFSPPEMSMPPRLPDAPLADARHDGELSTLGDDSSLLAAALGTPELPDMTPSDLPQALERRVRTARPTDDLVSGAQGRRIQPSPSGGFESAVSSRVVDMAPGVMQMSPGQDETTGGSWTDTSGVDTAEVDSAPGTGQSTDVWGPSPEDSLPEMAKILDAPKTKAPTPQPPKPSVPHSRDVVADRYRVLESIGGGGMARIFRVQHLELGKHFALKIIHHELSDDERVREMFYREARLASSLDHPNIVLLTDFGVDATYGAFIVMEYLKGETLHARLQREGRLHTNVACEVALQVAEALHFIHAKNVVHCDIKSENVFLCEPPPEQRRRTVVKLLDFGLSRQKVASGRVSASEVGGTPAYMAPERLNRASPRPSMDIYSLGVLFYEMITGTLPFLGSLEEVLIAQIKKKPERISKRMREPVDDRVEELVHKALRKDPDRRQKDMGAFIYELRTVMDMLGIGRRRGGQLERVRSGAAVSRVKNCELMVAECPLPLFMTDAQGNLVLANKAFSSFINIDLECAGTALRDTRLGRVCPEILADLEKVVSTRKQTQRILSFPWKTAKQVSMMIWLSPQLSDRQVVGVVGVIHPYTASSA
ncbi:MAG: protein kinase [bacterium]